MRYQTLTSFLLACLVWGGIAQPSYARSPDESEFAAAERIGDRIADWIANLERRPTSLGIFSVYPNYPLEQDYSTVVETEIMKSLAERDVQNVISCTECRANQVNLVNDRVVISKGAPDMETLKRIGKNQPVETFLVVEIYRTKLSVLAHAVLYQNPSGVLIAAERFRVTSVSFNDAATQVMLTVGLGKPLGAIVATDWFTSLNLSLLEELGFAKGGLTIGGVLGTGGTLLYLVPTIALRGRFGSGSVAWLLSMGAGYGMSGSDKGFAFKGGFDLTLGTLAVVGAEVSYMMPGAAAAPSLLQGFVGVHVGIALGR
ncbi:hypothetical protein K2X33_15490 [bacterium]|nr:hypothetical protein [bacterium]